MISIFGSGNLGTHLYQLFQNVNLPVKLVSSTNLHAIEIAKATFLPNEIVFITTKNDSISDLESKLGIKDQLVVHSSGADSLSILKSNNTAIFYPIQTFTKNKKVDWNQITVYLQANEQNLETLKKLATICQLNIKVVDENFRLNLHLAAVFVNNFTNALFCAASNIIGNANLQSLLPLIQETIDINKLNNPKLAQTGPAIRNDVITIGKHLELLQQFPLEKEVYIALTKYIQSAIKN